MSLWRRLFGRPPPAAPSTPREPAPAIDPADVARLFTETSVKGHDLTTVRVGDLAVPTGRIVACDMLVFPESEPFTRAVPPGTYAVDIAIARVAPDDERCAAARLVISDREAVRWEETGGYGVDAGVGSFMDQACRDTLLAAMDSKLDDRNFNYYDNVLAKELEGDRPTVDWTLHHPDPNKPHNVAVFSSGWGDGIYETFIGLDEDDNVTCFMTSFDVVV